MALIITKFTAGKAYRWLRFTCAVPSIFLSAVFFALATHAQVVAELPTGINITTAPEPGSGHDYLKLMQETVNPANGSLSLRIEAPVARQRGNVNVPYYIFGYDSGGVSIPTGWISYGDIDGTVQGSMNLQWTASSIQNGGSVQNNPSSGGGLVPGGFIANTGLSQTTYQYARAC